MSTGGVGVGAESTKKKIQFGNDINDLQATFGGEGSTMDPTPARIDVISAVVHERCRDYWVGGCDCLWSLGAAARAANGSRHPYSLNVASEKVNPALVVLRRRGVPGYLRRGGSVTRGSGAKRQLATHFRLVIN